ncbi:MAG: hypothetical protein ACE5HQ_04275 [Gemmatimonadota bacterium]
MLMLVVVGLVSPLRAQEGAAEKETKARVEALLNAVEALRAQVARDSAAQLELQRQLEAVLGELEALRLGREVVTVAESGAMGFGPAASKVYGVDQGVSIAGYGEVLYENFAGEREDGRPAGKTDRLDALRAILYVGYRFNDRILFNSEIEFEHGSTDNEGEASVEFAYLDYRLTDQLGLRAGLLLSPMGLINEVHEPPTFLGTTRPETERRILPSTWRENGLGLFGTVQGLQFRAYLLNGFDGVGGGSSKAEGFDASGLRGGRQNGSKAVAEDFAGVARVDYTGVLGLMVGGSVYVGQAGQNNPSPDRPGATIGARTLIWEGHAQYQARGLDLRGLFAFADLDDVAALNRARGLEGTASIGERLVGGYVQGGYDVLHRLATPHQLIPYVRYERLDTQSRVPSGFEADPANDQTIWSLGAAWKPIPSFVVKTDYQIHTNRADTGIDQWNVVLGYLF